jgi:flagellar biosynthetic protein FlhB
MSDAQERTEQATEKRMRDVRRKGELSTSKDLSAWLSVAAAFSAIPGLISSVQTSMQTQFDGLRGVIDHPTPEEAVQALGNGFAAIIPALSPMLISVVVAIIAGSALQGGIHFKAFSFSFRHFDLLAGIRRIFGSQAMWEGAKAILKTAVVGVVLMSVIQNFVPQLMSAGGMPLVQLVDAAQTGVLTLVETAIGAGLVLAAADVFVVMRRNRKKTMMTKREIKDESKSNDGDPLLKGMRRSRAFAMSRSRMMAAIADADVVLLNPTHIAVALKYEPGKSAPRVVAKGADEIAARIRERATEHRIPMVTDIPLARAIHAACEVGEEIPADLYAAVARVLAFVFALRARGAAQGVHKLLTPSMA